MRGWKKCLAAVLAIAILVTQVPLPETVAAQKRDTNTYTIENDFITYSINGETGGFSIRTLLGHPQKKYDDNKSLLFSGEGLETSYTTVRIDGTDYIFGKDYSFLGIPTTEKKITVNETEMSVTTVWGVKGIEVSQKVMISEDPNNELQGNAGIYYEVKNTSGEKRLVGIRTLLDVAIEDLDAPYPIVDTDVTATKIETEYAGEQVPAQVRGVDSINTQSQIFYLFTEGWDSAKKGKPDRLILGHWGNMASTAYDYSPDSNCDFTNNSSSFGAPDTAVSLYWEEEEIKETRVCEFLYGIGNFSNQLTQEDFNISMMLEDVKLTEDESGYQKDGEFEVVVQLDNTLDQAKDMEGVSLKLLPESGLEVVPENGVSAEETQTKYLGTVTAGRTGKVTWKVRAQSQQVITAKEVAVLLVYDGGEAVSTSRYVLLPGVQGNLPKVQFERISPEIVYTEGQKNFTVAGELTQLQDALKGNQGWQLTLEHKDTGEKLTVPKENIAFVEGKKISFSLDQTMEAGSWKTYFEFLQKDLKAAWGERIELSQEIFSSMDEAYKSIAYGIMAVERYEQDKYRWKTFFNEEDYQAYRKEHNLNQKNCSEQEILLEIRGQVAQYEDEKGTIYYAANPEKADVTFNNTAQYSGSEPLIIRKDGEKLSVKGKGKLQVIGSMTFWNSNFAIEFTDGEVFTLNKDKLDTEMKNYGKIVEIKYTGVGSIIQNLGGFAIDLKYGQFIELWTGNECGGYAIDFGGRMALTFIKQQKEEVTNPEPGSPETVTEKEYALSAAIDNVLFGPTEDGVKFKGIDATVGVEMPANVLGGFIKNPPITASLMINTIDQEYELNLGVNVYVLECSGTLRVKVIDIKGKSIPVPDKFYLSVGSTPGIPIVPPVFFLTRIAGGYDNLADTITGNTTSGLPSLTLLLGVGASVIQVLEGQQDLEIGFTGFKMNGQLSLSKFDFITIKTGIEAKWVDPFHIKLYGELDVLGVIRGGISVAIAKDYFYGYGYLSLTIPEKIPIIGGKELARIEGAISDRLVGMNLKVLGIKLGVAYYWEDGDVDFAIFDHIDLPGSPLSRMAKTITEEGETKEVICAYGTNLTPIEEIKEKNYERTARGISETAITISGRGQDAVLLTACADGAVSTEELEMIINGETYTLREDHSLEEGEENQIEGNISFQNIDGREYIYISITDADFIKPSMRITLSSSGAVVTDLKANGVENLPELTSVSAGTMNEDTREMEVSWSTDQEGGKLDTAQINLFLNTDPDILEKLQEEGEHESDAELGICLGSFPALNEQGQPGAVVTIPETVNAGDYYLIAAASMEEAGTSVVRSTAPVYLSNSQMPKQVKGITLENIGNGAFEVQVEEAENPDYTGYQIALMNEAGELLDATGNMWEIGEEIRIEDPSGEVLKAGESYRAWIQTYRDGEDGYRYLSNETLTSRPVVRSEIRRPKLLQKTSTIVGEGETISNNLLEVTYVFDQPVNLQVLENQVQMTSYTEYQTTWTYQRELEDGDYVVGITAVNESGDSYEMQEEDYLGFTIDTIAPVLMIHQEMAESLDEERTMTGTGGQVVGVTDGILRVSGMSDPGSFLTLDGSDEGIHVAEDGSFTIQRQIDFSGKLRKEMELLAKDEAGNQAVAMIYVEDESLGERKGIRILATSGSRELIPTEQDHYGTLSLETGTVIQIRAAAIFEKDGAIQEVILEEGDYQWNMIGDPVLKQISEQGYLVTAPGELCITLSETYGTFVDEEETRTGSYDAALILQVEGDQIDDAAIPEVSLEADTEQWSAEQVLHIYPKLYDGGTVEKVEIRKDGGEWQDITDIYEKGYPVTENGTYTVCIWNNKGVSSNVEAAESSITFTKIDRQQPGLLLRAEKDLEGSGQKIVIEITAPPSGIASVQIGEGGMGWQDITESYEEGYPVSSSGIYQVKVTSQTGIWVQQVISVSVDDPDNPDNPDDPDNPDNPDDPDNPDNPDNPDDPDNPTPGNPSVKKKVTSIRLNKTKETLFVKDTKVLTATVMPLDAANRSLRWSSTNPKVASVDAQGRITAIAAGNAVIRAEAADGSGIWAECSIQVVKPVIKLNAKRTKLQVKKSTKAIKASGWKAGDRIKKWTTSNKKVAKVNKKGKITAKKTGIVKITVWTVKGAKATCKIRIIKEKVVTEKLKLSRKKVTLQRGKSFKLSAERVPITALEKISWSSSNSKVAAVNKKGKITGKKRGKAVITARSSNGKKAVATVTVK